MTDMARHLQRSAEATPKIARVFADKVQHANERFGQQLTRSSRKSDAKTMLPWDLWTDMAAYSVDFAQRSVLFWDTLRQRGNNYVEHNRAGLPPVLHFDYEMVLDARDFDEAVNYALVRIVPPAGVSVDSRRRPYVIIDPRAGHGPGIGGFKEDSQVGVALRDGHPVYFMIFFEHPQPGQTLLDVSAAQRRFVRAVHDLHPHSPRPAIVGNCQGGWATMMVAATAPEDCGPLVINGAPMSYWGGAWTEGKGDNPMRYAGGLLGGSWLSSLTADLGNGLFDGAWLVQNFESLNPANTLWGKLYNVFAAVDTESERFLEFERWWGGYYLMTTEEIEWIVQNLFVGNKLWRGETQTSQGEAFDLRKIRSPIVLFASKGDNITPPQQAFNWVADVYSCTEEIIANGQVIVGLVHEDIGHLGIFVSGKVATKEHAEIVSVMKSIEALPPGLYAMRIHTKKAARGRTEYEVELVPKRLEEVVQTLNRFERKDEKVFEAAATISEFNQSAYELFGRPVAKALASEPAAELARTLHPLRAERWAWSDLNPMLSWLEPSAELVRTQRAPLESGNALREMETAFSTMVATSLDYYRAMRDASTETFFLQTFAGLYSFYLADADEASAPAAGSALDPRSLPAVQAALAAIEEGGYAEAVARIGYLLWRKGESFELWEVERRATLLEDYRELLPDVPVHEMRRIRGRQALICMLEPERAIETLPCLLGEPSDRARLAELFNRIEADPRIDAHTVTDEQQATYARIQQAVSGVTQLRAARAGGNC